MIIVCDIYGGRVEPCEVQLMLASEFISNLHSIRYLPCGWILDCEDLLLHFRQGHLE